MYSDQCVEKKKENFIKLLFFYMDKWPTHICKNCENTFVIGPLA